MSAIAMLRQLSPAYGVCSRKPLQSSSSLPMSRLTVTYTGLLMKGGRTLRRLLPRGTRFVDAVAQRLRSHVLPKGTAWVQVQDGYARGLWIEIDLMHERTWWAGSHEPSVQRALQQLVARGSVFYDIGAHIGFFSLPTARSGAQVTAFEPDPESAARLRKHATRNRLDANLRVIEAALWSRSENSMTFRRGYPRSQGGVLDGDHHPVIGSGPCIQVSAFRLDDFVARGNPAPEMIKIDVEGAAAEVLQGGIETLRAHRPALVVEVHTADEQLAIDKVLTALSYRTTWDIPRVQFPRQCFASGNAEQLQRL